MELRAPDLSGYSYCIIIYCLSPVSFKDAGLFFAETPRKRCLRMDGSLRTDDGKPYYISCPIWLIRGEGGITMLKVMDEALIARLDAEYQAFRTGKKVRGIEVTKKAWYSDEEYQAYVLIRETEDEEIIMPPLYSVPARKMGR